LHIGQAVGQDFLRPRVTFRYGQVQIRIDGLGK
jgi:hypothetical protein